MGEQLLKHGIEFIIQPQTRYEGQKGEQLTMFILDLSGNPLEFKAFKNKDELFAL
jgi:extradiol dioxygenase family protein